MSKSKRFCKFFEDVWVFSALLYSKVGSFISLKKQKLEFSSMFSSFQLLCFLLFVIITDLIYEIAIILWLAFKCLGLCQYFNLTFSYILVRHFSLFFFLLFLGKCWWLVLCPWIFYPQVYLWKKEGKVETIIVLFCIKITELD